MLTVPLVICWDEEVIVASYNSSDDMPRLAALRHLPCEMRKLTLAYQLDIVELY